MVLLVTHSYRNPASFLFVCRENEKIHAPEYRKLKILLAHGPFFRPSFHLSKTHFRTNTTPCDSLGEHLFLACNSSASLDSAVAMLISILCAFSRPCAIKVRAGGPSAPDKNVDAPLAVLST